MTNNNKILITSIIAITAILGFSVLDDQQAHAASMTFTEDTTITTDQTITSGEIWTVNPGVALTINPSVTVTVDNGGTIHNFGTIHAGKIDNDGVIIGINCGTGTTLNETTFQCVVDADPEISCGTGTQLNTAEDGCELTQKSSDDIAALVTCNDSLTTTQGNLNICADDNTSLQSNLDNLNDQLILKLSNTS